MCADQVRVPFQSAFSLPYLEKGKHLLVVPIPDSLAVMVGRVAIQWGAFEARMNQIITAVLVGYKREALQLDLLPFRRRKDLFKDLMVEYSTVYCPNETQALRDIAADAADLHWRRNIVLHGLVEIHGDGGTPPNAAFTAHGKHNGKKVTVRLDDPTLTKLWHDLAHLGGALMSAYLRMGGEVAPGKSPELIVPDEQLLRGPQSGSSHFLPIPHTQPRPRESS